MVLLYCASSPVSAKFGKLLRSICIMLATPLTMLSLATCVAITCTYQDAMAQSRIKSHIGIVHSYVRYVDAMKHVWH